MNAVSKTAYYCCGARMLDAESKNPLCNDIYARDFMDSHGMSVFSNFRHLDKPNISNAVRSRIIEDVIRSKTRRNTSHQIVLIGAGFDTKSYRIPGGNWIEIDEPEIISVKNTKLPVKDCPNSLRRISVKFSEEDISDIFTTLNKQIPTIFVIEGVFMYLEDAEIVALLQKIRNHFPKHELICDLMNKRFIDRQMKEFLKLISAFGSKFKYVKDDPEKLIVDQGYSKKESVCVIQRTVQMKGYHIPSILLNTILSSLKNGYTINVFETR